MGAVIDLFIFYTFFISFVITVKYIIFHGRLIAVTFILLNRSKFQLQTY